MGWSNPVLPTFPLADAVVVPQTAITPLYSAPLHLIPSAICYLLSDNVLPGLQAIVRTQPLLLDRWRL